MLNNRWDLSVIILNWNAAEDTIRCVHRISTWERPRVIIWVVDNNSSDGSVEEIARECPEARLIRNETNLGFAGGNNRGIAQALGAWEAPILLLNNDASIDQEDVIRLLNTLHSDDRIAFIGPLLFDAEHEGSLLSAGGRNPVLHHHSHIYELPTGEAAQIVEYVPGTVIIGRAQSFRTLGLFDQDYFFNMEVADLCMRARKKGYLSAIDTRAKASHALSRSSPFRETLYTYYVIRNRFLFIRKFYRNLKFPLFAVWALYSVALSLKVWLSGKPDMARAVRLGLYDGLQGRFGGQNERVLSRCSRSTIKANLSK